MTASSTTMKAPNRLIHEKSPYLLQHAYNPVDWYAWGDEAFTKAKQEDKPVFISIGYSTCHWCHVMERESFEDKEAADILNKYFISIKVDREERPDIDAVYMNAAQLMNGQGGWPLSVFTDTDKRPVFTGTYFPKKDGRYGIGFISLLERIAHLWKYDRAALFEDSIKMIEELNKPGISKDINYENTIVKGFNQFKNVFDEKYGGFGKAPKFPAPHNILFLLRYYHCKKEEKALAIAERTLQSMYNGGIYDHIGFGFCRYSTDKMWLVPHFEKMLYDNALLALAYCEAYHCTKNPFYGKAANEIFEYIERDMTAENGGFYNAEDADSEGIEGKFYVFTKHELIKLLGEKDGEKFCARYNITEDGNFEGENILNLIGGDDDMNMNESDMEFYEDCRKRIYKYREKRVRPFKDDKITASWNGLMICALAYGGRVLNNQNYINTAKNAISFILNNMTDEYGELYTRYRDSEAKFAAVADDYAYIIWGLIELYESTFESSYLLEAQRFNKILIDNFWDNGAICLSSKKSEKLIAETREIYDGAMPSANSVSINNFIKLSRLCDEHKLAEMAMEIVRYFGSSIETAPYAHSLTLCGLMNFEYIQREIIIAGGKNADFIAEIYANYSPFTTIAYADHEISENIEFYRQYLKKGESSIYICENSVCKKPVSDIEELRNALEN